MTPPAAVLWDAWRLRGDEEAFGRLVRPHLRALHDLARRVGVADADDAVQDALLELARHESPRPAEVGVAPWLMRSVWLRARTLRRTGRRRRQHEGAAAKPAEAALAAGEPSGVHEEVERVLASLAPDDRLVLLLRFLYDLDYREVAEVLGVSEATCRVRVHRATTRVRERLGDKAVLLLGSLPLEGTLPATGWIASAVARAGGSGLATAGGAIGMGATAKVAIGAAAAAVLLAGGVWWTTSRAREAEDGTQGSPLPLERAMREDPSPPVLAGTGRTTAEDPEPVEETAAAGEATPEPDAAPADRMATLIDQIRRNAAPDFWADPPDTAVLEAKDNVLLVRAPSDVQTAVGDYLGERAAAELRDVLQLPDDSDGDRPRPGSADALASLVAHARTILARNARMLEAVEHMESGDLDEARRVLTALLGEEPDNTYASAAQQKYLGDGLKSRQAAEGIRRTMFWVGALNLRDWLRGWPSKASWSKAEPLFRAIDPEALECRGPDLTDVIERGDVSLEAGGGTLYEALRALQIETFVDLDLTAAGDGLNAKIGHYSASGRSLGEILDGLLATVAVEPRLTWKANPRCIRIVQEGLEPTMRLRFFDVRHLVGEAPAPPSEVTQEAPPKPAQYRVVDGELRLVEPPGR